MKRSIAIVLFTLPMLLIPVTAYSEKIGFVDLPKLMEKAPQVEQANKALKKEFSSRDTKLASERDAIVRLEKKLQKDGAVMSESKRTSMERDIVRRKRDFNRSKEELAEDINLRRSEELSKLQKNIYEVIVALAKKESYDLIVTQGAVYASPKVDITNKVLSRLKSAR